MSREVQLQKALDKLRKGGKKIGEPAIFDGKTVISVDGVLMTEDQIFTTTEINPNT